MNITIQKSDDVIPTKTESGLNFKKRKIIITIEGYTSESDMMYKIEKAINNCITQ